MNKRFWIGSAVMAGVVSLCFVGIPACGGSSSDGGEAGHGGFILDSGPPDSSQEAAVDNDAQPDQSQPDASDEQEPGIDAEILEGSLFDLTMPDVMMNDSGATLQGCYDCAQANCSESMAACEADDKCRTLILCFFNEGCVDPTQQGGVDFGCAMGCAQLAGISNFQDPSALKGIDVATCMNAACTVECGRPLDGGVDAGEPDVVIPDTGADIVVQDVVPTDVNVPDTVEQDVAPADVQVDTNTVDAAAD